MSTGGEACPWGQALYRKQELSIWGAPLLCVQGFRWEQQLSEPDQLWPEVRTEPQGGRGVRRPQNL